MTTIQSKPHSQFSSRSSEMKRPDNMGMKKAKSLAAKRKLDWNALNTIDKKSIFKQATQLKSKIRPFRKMAARALRLPLKRKTLIKK